MNTTLLGRTIKGESLVFDGWSSKPQRVNRRITTTSIQLQSLPSNTPTPIRELVFLRIYITPRTLPHILQIISKCHGLLSIRLELQYPTPTELQQFQPAPLNEEEEKEKEKETNQNEPKPDKNKSKSSIAAYEDEEVDNTILYEKDVISTMAQIYQILSTLRHLHTLSVRLIRFVAFPLTACPLFFCVAGKKQVSQGMLR